MRAKVLLTNQSPLHTAYNMFAKVATGACRGTDGKLASHAGPNASDARAMEVTWWAHCS